MRVPNDCSLLAFVLMLAATSCLLPDQLSGQTLTLTEGTNIAVAASPDGESLAFDLQGTLWIVSPDGGDADALTDYLGDVRQPSWSPDSRSLVFQSYRDGNWHLWTVAKNGTALRQLTFGPYDDREPHWSPDGKRILFSSDRSGNYDVWILDVATGDVAQVTQHPANDYHPAWARDGGSFTYVSERDRSAGIFVDSFPLQDTTSPKRVYSTSARLAGPSFSPDGRYVSVQEFNRSAGTAKLVLVERDSGEVTTISAPNQDVFPFRAEWLSDSKLCYTADGRIQLADLPSGDRTTVPFKAEVQLDRPPYARKQRDFDSTRPQPANGLVSPTVAPDGEAIALTALGDLWLVGRDGTRQLTDDVFVQAHPSWSADGKSLYYISDRNGSADIWRYDLATDGRENVVSLPGNEGFPSLSPDGRTLVFFGASRRPLASNLIALDLDTGERRQVLQRPIPAGPLTWSGPETVVVTRLQPNSTRYREGVFEIVQISLADGSTANQQPVPNRTLSAAAWAPNGKRFAFIESGQLHVASFDSEGRLQERPIRVETELAANPSWAADSETLVYLSGTTIKRVNLADNTSDAIPTNIQWTRQSGSGRTVVHAGRLFNGRDLRYQNDVDIVIVNNRIESVRPHDPDSQHDRLIDASDKTVMPGLIEMHAHQSLLGGEKLGRTWLAFGITTVREPGADAYDALERKESWNGGRRPGPREFFSGRLVDGNRVYYSIAEGISSSEQLDLALRRAKALGYDLIKTYVRLPDALQKRVATAAHQLGIPTSSHELFPAASYGMDAMEHAGATSRRGYSPKLSLLNRSYDDVVSLLSTAQMTYTPTLVFSGFGPTLKDQPGLMENRQFAALYGSDGVDGLRRRMAMAGSPSANDYRAAQGRTSLAVLRRGGRVTTGTDAPFFPFGYGLHIEINLLVQAGFTPLEALRSATLWPAEAMGIDNDLGSIEPGKLADLIIIDGDPVNDIGETLAVHTTIKNGLVFSVDQLLEAPQ